MSHLVITSEISIFIVSKKS